MAWPPLLPDGATLSAIALPLLVALVLGWLVHRGLRALARRYRRRTAPPLRARLAVVVAPPASIAIPLLFLLAALGATPLPAGWIATLRHLLGIGVLLCVVWLLVRAVRALEARVVREHPIDTSDNLRARRVLTQARVISGVAQGAIVLVGVSVALMTFPAIRQLGATLLASAGILGLAAGIAARPVFGNLIAGLQIALAQPIRLDDVVIVNGEWGRIEEINSTNVVVRIWDERRLVVPLQWFIENPFENWTRTSAQLLGTAFLWLDYHAPLQDVREALQRICASDPRWDGRVCIAQVTDASERAVQVRLLVSARNSGDLFDLRCVVRERMIEFLRQAHPQALPRLLMDLQREGADRPSDASQHRALHALRRASPAAHAQTHSPGAEDVNAADLAGHQAADGEAQ
ncbi:MAG: mechanosensitive ion channel family protein, partial [Lysobacteraceae bacterium]